MQQRLRLTIWEEEIQVAGTSSNSFSIAKRTRRVLTRWKPEPKMVSLVPPLVCPLGGYRVEMEGGLMVSSKPPYHTHRDW